MNRSTNKIECCGYLLLYVQKKFNGALIDALNYLCEADRPEKYWENFTFYKDAKAKVQRNKPVDEEEYAQYVLAEDVTFVR